MSESLPELLDCKRLMRETGLSRAGAEALMRKVPTVEIEGLRKVYCRRQDVAAYLEARTFSKAQVPA
jgi:hypothetical protein